MFFALLLFHCHEKWQAESGVAVEKGTKAVISTNFSVHGERTFNNLRTNFDVGIP
jgi:hypothetical protein